MVDQDRDPNQEDYDGCSDTAYRASRGCAMVVLWAGVGFLGIVCLRGVWHLAGLVLGY